MSSQPGMHRPARAGAPGIDITPEEIRLVREAGQVLVDSYMIRGAIARDQPKEWDRGHILIALSAKLEALRRSLARRRRP